jgi:hypothetical protein
MGSAVIPLLLERLRDKPDYWFVALCATSNENPAPRGANFDVSRKAWLDWGRSKGLID